MMVVTQMMTAVTQMMKEETLKTMGIWRMMLNTKWNHLAVVSYVPNHKLAEKGIFYWNIHHIKKWRQVNTKEQNEVIASFCWEGIRNHNMEVMKFGEFTAPNFIRKRISKNKEDIPVICSRWKGFFTRLISRLVIF